jgi:hypothetical protein
MLWNKVILVAFGPLNDNCPQELLLVFLHVYINTQQYQKLPDHLSKMPRYIKLGDVWSDMLGQHRMLTWLRLACSFDDDIFEGYATMMGWINDPPVATHLRIKLPALKCWKRADGNVSFITNELIKLDTSKQYLTAVFKVRAIYQISRELHTNIDYKRNTKHTLKQLIIEIRASPTRWDEKLEKIKK